MKQAGQAIVTTLACHALNYLYKKSRNKLHIIAASIMI